ncbi:MAG TPA: TIGR02265 family protein [Hyalangium sp.]|nr:TIGR02265 family protein [Hyalangium sp.]
MSTADSPPHSRIKGTVLISRLNMVRQNGGQARLEEVLRRLPSADQALLRKMILPINWYPLELNLRLDAAIAEVLSPEDQARAFMEMGRASAEENLKGAQHVFVRQGDPHFLLSQAPQIYRFYYAVGSRTYEKVGPKAAILRTYGAENVTETDCLTIVGWHQRAIELSGGHSVRVTHTQCVATGASHCEYMFQWD